MRIKWQAAIFTAALAFTFAGCGGGEKPAPETSTHQPAPQQAEAPQ